MSKQTKSFLYFLALVVAFVTYSNIDQTNNEQAKELANNTIEKTTDIEALK